MTGAAAHYVSVPEQGLRQVVELVRRDLWARKSARESANGWVGSRRQLRKINSRELDLLEWFDEVAETIGVDREL